MSSPRERSDIGERSGVAVLAVTRNGARLGAEIAAGMSPGATLHVAARWADEASGDAVPFDGRLADLVAELFPRVSALVFVLATGAAVRLVAPLLGSKRDDPAVICVDDAGRHVIALLGGHEAGANVLAHGIAHAIGATPVITTASDLAGLPDLTSIARNEGWVFNSTLEAHKLAQAAMLAGERCAVFQDAGSPNALQELPPEWPRVAALAELRGWAGPRIAITERKIDPETVIDGGPLLIYRPQTLVLGVGCSLGAPPEEIEGLARSAVDGAGLAWESVGMVATIDRRFTEPGIVKLVVLSGMDLVTFTAEELAAVANAPTPSAEVQRHVGTPGVCEPAAILASNGGTLIVPKQKSAHATVAVARAATSAMRQGRLWLVGMGPGPLDLMTARARVVLREAELVIGYRGYLEMLDTIVSGGRLRPYELGQERERAAEAIRLARDGNRVALVSSGDIGIYGMAGLVFELMEENPGVNRVLRPQVEVIPGVTAATSAGALLGAPLMLDFAAISLSDLLVPWDSIRRRLTAAAEGDLVVVLYNPASTRRRKPFEEALAILRQHRSSETPVGLVRDAYRPDQQIVVATLGALPDERVDMRTVVVVGCSRTENLGGRLVTRRGYLEGGRQEDR